MEYISIAVDVDAATIKQELIDKFEADVPGVVIRDGHVLNFVFEADALQHAENRQLLTEVTDLIWDTFGAKILRVARVVATQATGATTWTRIDTPDFPLTAPLTVLEGTQLSLRGSGGDRVLFQTRNEVTFLAATPKAVTAIAATDLFTSTAHGYTAGTPVRFSSLTGGAGITPGTVYYVIASGLTTNDFKVSATVGGSTIDVTSNLTAGTVTARGETTDIGQIEIIAVDPGPDATGLQADPQLEEPLAWYGSIVVEAPTVGGAEGETDVIYRNRLADSAALMARTLVIADDFARDARTNFPLIERALPLDGYNPGDSTFGNGGYMTVAVVNDAGLDPGSTARDAGEVAQQALAISGMVVNWIAATYTAVTVVFAAVSYEQFDPVAVEAAAEAAVLEFLSPAQWGLPPFGDQRDWLNTPTVRYRDVVAAIENVEGLDYTTSVTVNGGTADVTLTGAAPLPSTASTASGTVTAP